MNPLNGECTTRACNIIHPTNRRRGNADGARGIEEQVDIGVDIAQVIRGGAAGEANVARNAAVHTAIAGGGANVQRAGGVALINGKDRASARAVNQAKEPARVLAAIVVGIHCLESARGTAAKNREGAAGFCFDSSHVEPAEASGEARVRGFIERRPIHKSQGVGDARLRAHI